MDVIKEQLISANSGQLIIDDLQWYLLPTIEFLLTIKGNTLAVIADHVAVLSTVVDPAVKLIETCELTNTSLDSFSHIFLLTKLISLPNHNGILITPGALTIYNNSITYSQINYESIEGILSAVLRRALQFAYIDPKMILLVLVPSLVEVNSLQHNLANKGLNIIVMQRSEAILLARKLNPNYVIDILLKQTTVTTWTGGSRYKLLPVSQEEARLDELFNCSIHRVITYEQFLKLPLLTKANSCAPAIALGKYPQELLDKVETIDINYRFPVACVVALIDSYGPSYFVYPANNGKSSTEYRLIKEKYYQRFFSKFIGRTGIVTLLNIWNNLLEYANYDLELVPRKIEEWSNIHSLNAEKMMEVYVVINYILDKYDTKIPLNTRYDLNTALDIIEPLIEQVYTPMCSVEKNSPVYSDDFHDYILVGFDYALSLEKEYVCEIYPVVTTRAAGNFIWVYHIPRQGKDEEIIIV